MKKIVKTIFLLIFISFVGCKINALELTKPGSRIYSINDGETIIEDNAYNFTFVDKEIDGFAYGRNQVIDYQPEIYTGTKIEHVNSLITSKDKEFNDDVLREISACNTADLPEIFEESGFVCKNGRILRDNCYDFIDEPGSEMASYDLSGNIFDGNNSLAYGYYIGIGKYGGEKIDLKVSLEEYTLRYIVNKNGEATIVNYTFSASNPKPDGRNWHMDAYVRYPYEVPVISFGKNSPFVNMYGVMGAKIKYSFYKSNCVSNLSAENKYDNPSECEIKVQGYGTLNDIDSFQSVTLGDGIDKAYIINNAKVCKQYCDVESGTCYQGHDYAYADNDDVCISYLDGKGSAYSNSNFEKDKYTYLIPNYLPYEANKNNNQTSFPEKSCTLYTENNEDIPTGRDSGKHTYSTKYKTCYNESLDSITSPEALSVNSDKYAWITLLFSGKSFSIDYYYAEPKFYTTSSKNYTGMLNPTASYISRNEKSKDEYGNELNDTPYYYVETRKFVYDSSVFWPSSRFGYNYNKHQTVLGGVGGGEYEFTSNTLVSFEENYLYRTIDVNNPFKNVKGIRTYRGKNWIGNTADGKSLEEAYISNRASSNSNSTPLYSFKLTKDNIMKIREYNKSHSYGEVSECESNDNCFMNYLYSDCKSNSASLCDGYNCEKVVEEG